MFSFYAYPILIFHACIPIGVVLHLVDVGLAVGSGDGDECRSLCHALWGDEGGVGVAALVMRDDFGRVAILGGEARQRHGLQPLGVVRQDDGHPCRAVGEAEVGEAECGVAVAHRLFLGHDEVAALEVLPGTLVGFYHHGRRGCLPSGVGPPGGDEAIGVVGPVVRVIGGQHGAGVVGGGGRHIVCLHRAVHPDCHALHALPVPVHGGTGTGGGSVKTMGVPSAPSGRKPASSCVQAAAARSRASAENVYRVYRFISSCFYYLFSNTGRPSAPSTH